MLVKEFIRLCPKSEVSYLNGELSPMELKEFGFTGLDYHYKSLAISSGLGEGL